MKKLKNIFMSLLCMFFVATTNVAVADTCTSSQIDTGSQCVDTKFTVNTINLTTNKTFKFVLSAAGTFYVDWGDGTVDTFTRADTTPTEYPHTYATGGIKNIRFAGVATEYNTTTYSNDKDASGAAIRFGAATNNTSTSTGGSPTLIASLEGSVGAVFPTLGVNSNQIPIFYEFCLGCSNLTTISGTLFSGVTGAKKNMFRSVFDKCSKLAIIPDTLFSGVSGSAESMFRSAFYQCLSLTNLPESLFAGINGGAKSMFKYTFFEAGTNKIPNTNTAVWAGTYIPAHLFDGAHDQNPSEFMSDIFTNSGLATSCPAGTEPFTTIYDSQWGGKVACAVPSVFECGGATYKNVIDVCLACPPGYDYDKTTGKTSIDQCKIHCDAGTWTGEYTQLEYLEASGTQYIDTGHLITKTKLNVTFEISADHRVSGTIGHLGGNQDVISGHAANFKDSTFGVWVQSGSSGSKVTVGGPFDANIIKRVVYNFDGKNRTLTVDGESESKTFSGSIASTNTYKLFSNGCTVGSGGCNDIMLTGRMHGFTMTEGSTKVFDMIPARRTSDNAIGMYDRITGKFFQNVGTGSFTAGPDVATIGGSVCEDNGYGFYSGDTVTNYGSVSQRTACQNGQITLSTNATSSSNCVNAGDNIVCDAGTYVPANSYTCTTCPAGSWCPGGVLQTGAVSDQGLFDCATEIGAGWSSESGATAQTSCYYLITLDKNGFSGIVYANSGAGCHVVSTATTTTNATLKLFYDTECVLPSINLTKSGLSNAQKWSAIDTVTSSVVNKISPVTSTPSTTRYYAQKLCPANKYASAQGASCSSCGANSSTEDRNAASTCTCDTGYTSDGTINGAGSSTNGCSAVTGQYYSCNAGYYLPAESENCTKCPANNYCPGGIYYASASAQGITPCPSGLIAPSGMWESDQCGHKLNIGNNLYVYLRRTKQTTPSLNLDVDNDGVADFFSNMTTQPVPANVDFANLSEYNKIIIEIPSDFVNPDETQVLQGTYYIYDDTVEVPQQ